MTKTKMQPGWWIATHRLDTGAGNPVMGPFVTRELALEVRALVEKVQKRSDLWVQEVNDEGIPVW